MNGKSAGQVHIYYIATDEVVRDYAPIGLDEMTGEPFSVQVPVCDGCYFRLAVGRIVP